MDLKLSSTLPLPGSFLPSTPFQPVGPRASSSAQVHPQMLTLGLIKPVLFMACKMLWLEALKVQSTCLKSRRIAPRSSSHDSSMLPARITRNCPCLRPGVNFAILRQIPNTIIARHVPRERPYLGVIQKVSLRLLLTMSWIRR